MILQSFRHVDVVSFRNQDVTPTTMVFDAPATRLGSGSQGKVTTMAFHAFSCLPAGRLVGLPSSFNPRGTRMQEIRRRSFLQLALAALPLPLLAQTKNTSPLTKPFRVSAGLDREEKKRSIGLSSTTYKVLTQDTGGALFVLEQSNQKKGGPPRHLHHDVDELFYSLEGEYIVEVGSERFRLKPGDCALGPREIPHAWAFAGGSPGRLLISFAPAGKMEAFFNERENHGIKPGAYTTDASFMRAFGMELIGPPLVVE